MVTEQYLIAHKVRGEPAFDVAEKMEVDGEEWWVIPTSGHRAYPYWSQPIDEFTWNWGGNGSWTPYDDGYTCDNITNIPSMPPDTPEHYEVTAAKGKGKGNGQDLLKLLGLVKPQEPMTRRGW